MTSWPPLIDPRDRCNGEAAVLAAALKHSPNRQLWLRILPLLVELKASGSGYEAAKFMQLHYALHSSHSISCPALLRWLGFVPEEQQCPSMPYTCTV